MNASKHNKKYCRASCENLNSGNIKKNLFDFLEKRMIENFKIKFKDKTKLDLYVQFFAEKKNLVIKLYLRNRKSKKFLMMLIRCSIVEFSFLLTK